MRNVVRVTLIGLSLTVAKVAMPATVATAQQVRRPAEQQIHRVVRQAFPKIDAEWQARLTPDATMTTCAAWKNTPPKAVADAIKVRERARIVYPQDGVFMGDWRQGEVIAQSGYGLRFTDTGPKRENGGNCYACHQLSPQEVSFGTVGVSLKNYGRIHKFSAEEARIVYEKIYNSQAKVACSQMPRFGTNGVLSVDQIKDLVALLMDPESPVNTPPATAPDARPDKGSTMVPSASMPRSATPGASGAGQKQSGASGTVNRAGSSATEPTGSASQPGNRLPPR